MPGVLICLRDTFFLHENFGTFYSTTPPAQSAKNTACEEARSLGVPIQQLVISKVQANLAQR
jgi:hypothetical protein